MYMSITFYTPCTHYTESIHVYFHTDVLDDSRLIFHWIDSTSATVTVYQVEDYLHVALRQMNLSLPNDVFILFMRNNISLAREEIGRLESGIKFNRNPQEQNSTIT